MVLDFVRKVLNNNNDNGNNVELSNAIRNNGDKTLELSNGIRNNGDKTYSL